MPYIILRGHWCNIIALNVHAPREDKSDGVKDSFYQELGRVFNQFPRHYMKILLRHSNAKLGRGDNFKPKIGDEGSHKISNDNGVRVVNFVTCKNLVDKSTMSPHRSIHKYTWTSPVPQLYSSRFVRRRHSSTLDVRSFRGTDCDIDHYLVVAEVRERLAVSKRAARKIDSERFNLKHLNPGEIKVQYRVTTTNKFAALENLEDYDINRA
jgi:hypothetical protein